MSTTYSNNLRLSLIGTGDQAGTWGTTTNTNLGTLLEQSIAGYTTYACSGGTDTLVIADGATSTARNMYIQFTGTGGGTVTVPAYTKLYYIYNSTAAVITLKVSGQTGVPVPAGAKMSLVNNGTDVVLAIDSVLTPTPGTNSNIIANTAFVQTALALALQVVYPVGSIYTSTVSTNPASLFGFGTWVAFGAGRVMVGNGGGFSAGSTGGSADAIVVSHNHTASSSFSGQGTTTGASAVDHTHNYSGTTNGQSANHTHAISIADPGHTHSTNGGTFGGGPQGLVGGGNPYLATATIGTSTTGITASAGTESADHNHTYSGATGSTNTSTSHSHTLTPAGSVSTSVDSAGASGTSANLQPYVVVYMWNRTA